MHILLVEDSDEVSMITVEYLQELQHSVDAVPDAEQAVERLARHAYDAVMTDVRLPGMSGIDLARVLQRDYPRLPVIIASGYGAIDRTTLPGETLANVLVLPKPYDLDQLEQTLAQAAAIAAR
jgi:CheY-like chemotaxis protein